MTRARSLGLAFLAHRSPIRMVAMLRAARLVASDGLDVRPRIGSDSHFAISWRDGQGPDASARLRHPRSDVPFASKYAKPVPERRRVMVRSAASARVRCALRAARASRRRLISDWSASGGPGERPSNVASVMRRQRDHGVAVPWAAASRPGLRRPRRAPTLSSQWRVRRCEMVRLPAGELVPALGQGTWMMGEQHERRAAEIAALPVRHRARHGD